MKRIPGIKTALLAVAVMCCSHINAAYGYDSLAKELSYQVAKQEIIHNREPITISPAISSFFSPKPKFFLEKNAYLKQSLFRLPKPVPNEGEESEFENNRQSSLKTAKTDVIKPHIKKEPIQITYDIDIEQDRESVKRYINYFQNQLNGKFEKWLQKSGTYLPMIKKVFRNKGLPEDLAYLSLIESGFNQYAYSRSRAAGMWQFIPGTGLKYGLKINSWVDERRDPEKSARAAADYLSDLYDIFESWPLALASYNAGEGRIGRTIRRARTKDFWKIRRTRYIRRETKDYVPKFMAGVLVGKNPEKYGFSPIKEKAWRYDRLTIKKPLDLRVLSEILKVDYKTIKDLNPELRKSVTPLNADSYTLRLPAGTKQMVSAALQKIEPEKMMVGRLYRVKKGDSLYRIAKRESASVSLLAQMNNLSRKSILTIGKKIYIPSIKSHSKKRKKRYTVISKSSGKKKIRYKVRRGDSLWTIARSFNVSLKSLRKWNRIWGKTIIKPGQHLTLFIR